MKTVGYPKISLGDLPSTFADSLGSYYTSEVTLNHKKGLGQFFTPIPIAKLMGSFLKHSSKRKVRILDPGCGTAVLSCALIERLVIQNRHISSIELVLFETDDNLKAHIQAVLKYLRKWLAEKKILLKYRLYFQDFILHNSKVFQPPPLKENLFDIIISNPPYFKLSTDDPRAILAKQAGLGQSNIYSLFAILATSLLKNNGELIFIIPRSFCSGSYFRTFRETFFMNMQLNQIHLFSSRKDVFYRDKVLQETIILNAFKSRTIDDDYQVAISSSKGLNDIEKGDCRFVFQKNIINRQSKEKILHFPINESEKKILDIFKSWKGNLEKYNIKISTGPVVGFRISKFIQENYENGTIFLAPLLWLHNVDKMHLEWPSYRPNRGQYIRILPNTKSILLPNKGYIFLRRFSSKEDNSRLVAAPYFRNDIKCEFIGVENKLNYIYRPNGDLDKEEILGLSALLNSDLYNKYFSIFNGNVNVSATELREIPLPPITLIRKIGNILLNSSDYKSTNINSVVNANLKLTEILQDG